MLIGQALSSDLRDDGTESISMVHVFAIVVSKRLVVFCPFLSLCIKRASPPIIVSSASTGAASAAEFSAAPILQREPNTMEHEPCGLLGNANRAVNLPRANPVLAIGDHPDSREPLIQSERRVLEYGPDLDAELVLRNPLARCRALVTAGGGCGRCG